MQFKRPSAYPGNSAARIITDRKKVSPAPLQTAPHTLFFNLREKKESHQDFQHNVLLRLRQRLTGKSLGDAVYVCPLFLERSAYRFNLHVSALKRWAMFWRPPYDWHEFILDDSGLTVRFDRIPVLSEHICIPPHTTVTSARHSYSFNEDGTQVCFHSPQFLPDGGISLSKWLMHVTGGYLTNGPYVTASTATDELRGILLSNAAGGPLPHAEDTFQSDDGIQSWLSWGHFLHETYAIEQFALIPLNDAE